MLLLCLALLKPVEEAQQVVMLPRRLREGLRGRWLVRLLLGRVRFRGVVSSCLPFIGLVSGGMFVVISEDRANFSVCFVDDEKDDDDW